MNSFKQSSRTIAIVASVVGGVVLLGVGATAAVATFGSMNASNSGGTQSLDVSGITGIEVESNAADFELVFADVSEAQLDVSGNSTYRWEMSVEDGDLVIDSKRGFFDFCIGWCNMGEQQVTLTLPNELDSGKLDAELQLNAGTLNASGSWNDLAIEVAAGALEFDGSANSLDTSVSAGRAILNVEGARTADLEIAAGQLIAELTGRTPDEVSVDVSAGKLELTVPADVYDVRSDVSAGSLDNRLDTSSRSSHRIEVSVSAGSAVLRDG